MKVSKSWLLDLVDLKVPMEKVEKLLSLRTIATKEINDNYIELDMKGYNRADLLSLRGVAYEVAAITDSQVKFEETEEFLWTNKDLPEVKVEVEDSNKCTLYCVAKIEGLKVEGSPADWVKKLGDSGVRSVNNIADVTNLVMLEYGQPLHSFDGSQVADETIVVRGAKEGEKIKTLDGKERELTSSDLVIADPKKTLGLAGVMGGKNSEITENTQTILLEAAIFDPQIIRKTVQRLNLPSEASKRFQHGLTKKRLLQALDAAIKLYQGLGGKVTALTIKGDTADQLKKIPLRLKKTNSLIGIDLDKAQVEEYLRKLHFELADEGQSWVVTPPYWRLDIEIEEDLIEEVARMYGYENIPSKELPGTKPAPIDQKLFELIFNLKQAAAEAGFTEVQTYSFFSTQVLNAYGWTDGENLKFLVKVANPISSETEYLRQNISASLIEVAAKNLRQGFSDIAIFEVGKVFYPQKSGPPKERYSVALLLSDGSDEVFLKLYQISQEFFKRLSINLEFKPSTPPPVVKDFYHPKKFMSIFLKDKQIGGTAEVHPRLGDKFGVHQKMAILEVYLEDLVG